MTWPSGEGGGGLYPLFPLNRPSSTITLGSTSQRWLTGSDPSSPLRRCSEVMGSLPSQLAIGSGVGGETRHPRPAMLTSPDWESLLATIVKWWREGGWGGGGGLGGGLSRSAAIAALLTVYEPL